MNPIPPPMVHDDDGGDVQIDNDDTPFVDDVNAEERVEQVLLDPPAISQLRRTTRERQSLRKYSLHEYVLLTDGGEPECYEKDISHKSKEEWLKAMEEEMKSLHDNHTCDLVKLPKGKRTLKNKWVYKLKIEKQNSQSRYKARLVVKGFGH